MFNFLEKLPHYVVVYFFRLGIFCLILLRCIRDFFYSLFVLFISIIASFVLKKKLMNEVKECWDAFVLDIREEFKNGHRKNEE